MNFNDITYSYPIVMSGRDDITSLFMPVKYNINKNDLDYIITIDFGEQNLGILSYIADGHAKYVCEIECNRTCYRDYEFSDSPNISFHLSRQAVLGHVNFNCYIVVVQAIENYHIENLNSQYEGYKINLEPGDVIGNYGNFGLDADINYEMLNHVETFMEIKETQNEKMHFNLEGEKIIIEMPTALFATYKDKISGDRFANIIHSSLVCNALMYALYNYEEFSDKKWARIIKNRVEIEPNLIPYKDLKDKLNVPNLANELLQNPYERLFNTLVNINKIED